MHSRMQRNRAKTSKSDADAKPASDFDKFSFSRFTEIKLAGDSFRFYSQPLQISLPSIDHAKKNKEENLAQPEQWVLCGLVRVEAFRSESQSISNTVPSVVFCRHSLLVMAAYPFLRLRISSPAERLRASRRSRDCGFDLRSDDDANFRTVGRLTTAKGIRPSETSDGPMRKSIAKAIDDNLTMRARAHSSQLTISMRGRQAARMHCAMRRNTPSYIRHSVGDQKEDAIRHRACRTGILEERWQNCSGRRLELPLPGVRELE